MSSTIDWPASTAAVVTVTATAILTTTFLALSRTALWPHREKTLASPLRTTLPKIPRQELDTLVYRPDQFPGARDVETPYGSIRVYEFGPEDGQKVVFIHGISTSCVTLGRIAEGLVERGCRVMLFDLFGRGFSDGVGDLPHDSRLYLSQILFVLASSDLSWTGTSTRLRVVGYSLGGGIAVHFANTFPHLVDSLVLLAPAGLIRAESFGAVSRFVFSSGLVPERILAVLTKKRLQQPIASSRQRKKPIEIETPVPPEVEAAVAEAADPPSGQNIAPIEHRVLLYVRWMVENHAGFVPAFMSCIRHAPLTDQHQSWAKLAERKPGSTIIMVARSDEIIDADEYTREALPLVGGEKHVEWRLLNGGHDFVMTHAQDILRELDGIWGTKA